MDPDRAAELDIRGIASAVELAAIDPDHPRDKEPQTLPSVSDPDPRWHDRLMAAWPEIHRLASTLMDGESSVRLNNGQTLVRYASFDYWYDPNRVKRPRPRWVADE